MQEDIVESPYGRGDVIGAANEIDAHTILSGARLVTRGVRYSLSQILTPSSPTQPWRYWRHALLTDRARGDRSNGDNAQTYVEEIVSGALHSGTHLDGLAHIGIGDFAYNGHRWSELISADGVAILGIERIPPLVGRGVLLDVTKVFGVEQLSPETSISSENLQDAADAAGVRVGRGDLVFIHTGWGRLWEEPGSRYGTVEPGIDLSAASWLAQRRVTTVGSDNWAVEFVTDVPSKTSFPVHQELITRSGIFLLENARTAELARDSVTEFFCVISPIRLKGASASMVNPVAVV